MSAACESSLSHALVDRLDVLIANDPIASFELMLAAQSDAHRIGEPQLSLLIDAGLVDETGAIKPELRADFEAWHLSLKARVEERSQPGYVWPKDIAPIPRITDRDDLVKAVRLPSALMDEPETPAIAEPADPVDVTPVVVEPPPPPAKPKRQRKPRQPKSQSAKQPRRPRPPAR